MRLTEPTLRRKLLDVPGSVSIGIGPVEHDDEVRSADEEEKRQEQFHSYLLS